MKRTFSVLFLMALLGEALFAQPRRYSIQPSDASRLELRVFKTGLYRGKFHTFLFPNYKGTLVYDSETPQASQITLTLGSGSAKCIDTWLSPKDLVSVQKYALEDMLAAEKYPEILFTSSELHSLGEN